MRTASVETKRGYWNIDNRCNKSTDETCFIGSYII